MKQLYHLSKHLNLIALSSLLFCGLWSANVSSDHRNGRVFSAQAEPRDPIHFVEGTGFNDPTTFEAVRDFALSNGVYGIKNFTVEDWLDVDGRIVILKKTHKTSFIIKLEGMVPGGVYTAWLVRKGGSPRGAPADLDLGTGYEGGPSKEPGTNLIQANRKGKGRMRVRLSNDFTDANGQAFISLDNWDEIHVAFHSDNRAYGASPGPNHWTQIVLPVRR